MAAVTLISDLAYLSSSIVKAVSLALLCVLSLAVLGITFLVLALVSPAIVPLGILFLVGYSVYQCLYPSVPSVVTFPSHEDTAYLEWLPCDDEDNLVLVECATWEEYYSQFSPVGTELTVTEQEATPVCSITYALISTTGSDDTTLLFPVHTVPSVDVTEQYITTAQATRIMDESVVDSLAAMDRDSLVAYARTLGIKGISARWTDDTIKRKVMERTLSKTVAA